MEVVILNHAKKSIATVLVLSLLTLIITAGYMAFTKSSIVGVVYAQSSVPVAGATITVVGPNASAVATTDSHGNYAISSGLGTGTCSITVTASGYVSNTVTAQISAGSTTTVPGIVLTPSGIVSGAIYSVANVGPPPPPT